MSLKELVEKHGFGIIIGCSNRQVKDVMIHCEDIRGERYIAEVVSDGKLLKVMKECAATNDYYLRSASTCTK